MSIDYRALSDADLLRAAIQEARDGAVTHGWDARTTQFALGQMYAGTVRGNAELEQVWQEETAPMQVEVDLHLEGDSIHGHATNARQLAAFVEGLNKATKHIVARDIGGRGRDLLIEGVLPGSVRVVLHADGPKLPQTEAMPVEPGTHFQSSPDSEALRAIARLLTIASDDEPAIAAEVRALPQLARSALKGAVEAARVEGWEVAGTLRQRGLGSSPVHLTPHGAAILVDELAAHQYEDRTEWMTGTIDGYRRSLGSFYFTPAGGKPFAVSAAPDQLAKTAELAADPDVSVRAQIMTVTAAESEADRITTSRMLVNIEPAAAAPEQAHLWAVSDGGPAALEG